MTTLAIFQSSIVNNVGNVLPNAQVSIRDSESGAYVAVYSDAAGALPILNPFYADSEGFASVYVAPGKYIIAMSSGLFTRQLLDVLIGTSLRLVNAAPARVSTAVTAGTVNNLAVADSTGYVDLQPTGDVTITGMTAGYDGQEVTLCNNHATYVITLAALSGSSSAGNQLRMAGDLTSLYLMPWTFKYSTAVSKWLLK